MTRDPGMNPALARWNRPGSSLRRDRSPVAPKSTTTCGNLGPTPAAIFATIHPALFATHPGRRRGSCKISATSVAQREDQRVVRGLGLLAGNDLDGNRFGVGDVHLITL